MKNQQTAVQKLHEAFDEMFHQYIVYEEGPKNGTEEEVYVDSHPGASIMLQYVERFIKGEICLGEAINFAIELQDLYGYGYGLSPTAYPSRKLEVPGFIHQLAYLISSALFENIDKGDIYGIGSIKTDIHPTMGRYYSNNIYELTVETLLNFCNTVSYTEDKDEYYQQWTEEEIINASKKYPLLLEKYKKYRELVLERQRIYAKVLPDVRADQEQYKDFDYDSYIKDRFPLADKSKDKGYFRNAYETSGYKYFDVTEVYKNNPMFVTLLSRNYTSEEFDMYRYIGSHNNPYNNFKYAISRHLFNSEYDECECDFEYFEEFMKTSTPSLEDYTIIFATDAERDKYMSVALQCWEKIKYSTIDYGNYATSLSSTVDIQRCLLLFASLSNKYDGMQITDDKNNQIFADGSYQNKNSDYHLATYDTLGVEGASFRSSELNKQRLAFCFKKVLLVEVRKQFLEQSDCPDALTNEKRLKK